MRALRYNVAMAIIDSHLHLITASMLGRQRDRLPAYRKRAMESARVRGKTFEERLKELEGRSLEDHARSWLEAFDTAGIQAGAFIAVGEGNEELAQFVRRLRPGFGVAGHDDLRLRFDEHGGAVLSATIAPPLSADAGKEDGRP